MIHSDSKITATVMEPSESGRSGKEKSLEAAVIEKVESVGEILLVIGMKRGASRREGSERMVDKRGSRGCEAKIRRRSNEQKLGRSCIASKPRSSSEMHCSTAPSLGFPH